MEEEESEMTIEEGNRAIVVRGKNAEGKVEMQRNSSKAITELGAFSEIITSIQALATS